MTMLRRPLWGLVCALVAIAMSVQPAISAEEGIVELGRIDMGLPADVDPSQTPASTSLIIDSARRRGFQLLLTRDQRTIARVYDLDARRLAREEELPRNAFPGGPVSRGDWVHALDPSTGTLYVAFMNLGFFGGVTAIDGDNLDIKGTFLRPIVTVNPGDVGCTSNSCLPQVPTAAPNVKGMAIVPSELTGNPTKILLWMEEQKPFGLERNFNIPWLAQWDARTGRQDWIYRVAACSNSGFPLGSYPLGVFQASLTAGIYVACAAQGGTGQVVRVTLDGNGRPAAEQAYPGPLAMADALADPGADRMLIKVANAEGDSWWVFDGTSSAYTGVIGSTIAPANTAAGIDPTSGRLYVLAGKTFKGERTSAGGLLLSDSRRSPAPQMLAFEEFSEHGTGSVVVDVHPTTGERVVYARPFGKLYWRVFKDTVPISTDPDVDDQDRLTIQDPTVEKEDPSIHGRNFGGSTHAYGARALLVGGLNGTPATGPDISSIRVGRHAPTWTNSPCGTGDRELIVGTVRNAALSNQISSASATISDVDAGTPADLGEPTARCYPRPTDSRGQDVWGQIVGADQWRQLTDAVEQHDPEIARRMREYPRPLETDVDGQPTASSPDEPKTDADELLGTSWPFRLVECSGDESASTDARVRPLDRGDEQTGPIPAELRRAEATIPNGRANVACKQGRSRVDAASQVLLHAADGPALSVEGVPGIGSIRVGEVSSSTSLFIDPARGLVARSIAVARDISIGDHVFIDEASMTAEAWARGLAGTAGTDWHRRLCGVRIKDEAPDKKIHRPVVEPNTSDPGSSRIDPQGGAEISKTIEVQGCSSDPVQQGQPSVIDLINRALGARGRASAPLPDGKLAQGTPGGYLASVQKDRFDQISSQSVNNDPTTHVPALELIVFNDDPEEGRGRQIYQFAGVDASVTYGIFLLNPDELLDGDGDTDLPEELVDFTGGTPGVEPPAEDTGTAPAAPRGPITMMFSAVSLLLRSPRDALLAAAIWLLLFAPVHLATRRRALKAVA